MKLALSLVIPIKRDREIGTLGKKDRKFRLNQRDREISRRERAANIIWHVCHMRGAMHKGM